MEKMIFYNGEIITMDDHIPRTEAVFVENGFIKQVGNYKDMQSIEDGEIKKIDLKGKALLPGFIQICCEGPKDDYSKDEINKLSGEYLFSKGITTTAFATESIGKIYDIYEKNNAAKPDIVLYLDYEATDEKICIILQN